MPIQLETVLNHVSPLLSDRSFALGFASLALVLLLAQAVNYLRLRSPSATETNRKVAVIIGSWWRILFFGFFAFWGGTLTIIPIMYFLTLFAILEYSRVSALAELRARLFWAAALAITFHYLALVFRSSFLFFGSFHIFVLLVLMPSMILSKKLDHLPKVMAFLFGVMTFAIFLSFPVAVMVFESEWIGSEAAARMAVLLLIVLTELNDVFQFLCGKLFGKRKIIPWISPNKTEAGFIGGLLFSVLLGALLWPKFLPISLQQAIALSALLSLGGMLGDLVCSAVKRHREVKDFSDLIPGHGGLIDRVDSLLVTAPIFFFFLYWLQHQSLSP